MKIEQSPLWSRLILRRMNLRPSLSIVSSQSRQVPSSWISFVPSFLRTFVLGRNNSGRNSQVISSHRTSASSLLSRSSHKSSKILIKHLKCSLSNNKSVIWSEWTSRNILSCVRLWNNVLKLTLQSLLIVTIVRWIHLPKQQAPWSLRFQRHRVPSPSWIGDLGILDRQ